MGDLVLGIDIGTGSTKAGLVESGGRLVAVARCSHPPAAPEPGWSETDPEDWRQAVAVSSREVLQGIDGSRVVGIGLSGQMHGVVVCGSPTPEGTPRPLRPAVLWSDRRAQPDLDRLHRALTPELTSELANPIVAGMAGSTMIALQRLEPELRPQIRHLLQPKDWLRCLLTGIDQEHGPFTDPSDASATLLWNVVGDRWSAAAQELFAVDASWLPTIRRSSEVSGELSASAASLLGLAPGLPVATGAADTAAALYGAGLHSGQSQLSTGSGGQLARLLDRPTIDPSHRTHLYRGVDRDGLSTWYAMAAIQNCGLAIDWALRLLGLEPGSAATTAILAAAMAEGEPGSGGVTFLPFLTGERTPHLDAGLCGAWVGLRPSTGRQLLIRSVFEGVAFALGDGLGALLAAGHGIEDAFLAGGGSVAPWWRQLLADALELPLIPRDIADASVRGAGLLAWSAVGHEPDPQVGLIDGAPIMPSPEMAGRLQPARQRYHQRLVGARPAPETD